ncbi:MAG: purine-binding chemotaxis protein CheW [Geobacter sp.]|nr:purine-binding chemotaxis protein CheW [Geobacter sp.]
MSMLPVARQETKSSSNKLIQLVSFTLDQEEYGVDVLHVREIIRMPAITKMPNTPYFVEGIISLRGKVIPIICLRKRFGLPDQDANQQTRIMVMDISGGLLGFVVDSVAEVIRIRSEEIQPPPPLISGSVTSDVISGVFDHAGHLLIIMDIGRMFSYEEQAMLELG